MEDWIFKELHYYYGIYCNKNGYYKRWTYIRVGMTLLLWKHIFEIGRLDILYYKPF